MHSREEEIMTDWMIVILTNMYKKCYLLINILQWNHQKDDITKAFYGGFGVVCP